MTVVESVDLGIPAPVLTLALQVRFRSQEKQKGYGYKLLSIMRNAFGGHNLRRKGYGRAMSQKEASTVTFIWRER